MVNVITANDYAFLFMSGCAGLAIIAHTANLIHRGLYERARSRAIRESIEDMRRREADLGF